MKKKIAILGSTGSIGRTLINILYNEKKKISIKLLTTNKNYKLVLIQAKKFNVKNVVITDKNSFLKCIKNKKNIGIKIYNDFNSLNQIFLKRIDYVMSSISGIDGMEPTYNIIKYTKKIAIANKEGIICGWNLLKKQMTKYRTEFLPVDSEHFSIWYALKNNNDEIDKIFLTASGGPFYNLPLNKFKDIKLGQALKHPNWKMGKKISIDSATMMNKVFEIIEAKKIFNIKYSQLKILNHPKSYIHAIVQFSNGMSKLIAHNTSMKIPIFNTLYNHIPKRNKPQILRVDLLNNLALKEVDYKKFPLVKILKSIPRNDSLFETVLVSINDALVDLFLKDKIKFNDISKKFIKLINYKEFNKYKKIAPKKIEDITNLSKLVHLKVKTKSI